MYTPNIQRAVLPPETSDAAHVIAVVAVLVAAEAVNVGREDVGRLRQAVQVLAVDALGADAAREEEAEVGAGRAVGFGVPTVFGNVASALRGGFAEVLVFALLIFSKPIL